MTQSHRLSSIPGRIDRTKPLSFSFDGKIFTGLKGDSLASALLANGVKLVGRSFKYHRPRGIMAAGVEEPNALCQLYEGAYSTPNIPAPIIDLHDGLVARSQNRWPSLNFDLSGFFNLVGAVLPAGFYYKTFMWPGGRFWLFYEHFIRKSAGLGVAPRESDPARYDNSYIHCDVLVAGAGISGLMAALSAARSGARTILLDEQNEAGGALLHEKIEIDGKKTVDFVEDIINELEAMENVTFLPKTTVAGYYDANFLAAIQRLVDHPGAHPDARPDADDAVREKLWQIRAKQVILATGAIERPPVFANNDRPGVMLADAVRCYINRYAVLPGQNIAFFTNNDYAWQAAFDASEAGAIVTIIDCRIKPGQALEQKAKKRGIEVYLNSAVIDVRGKKAVSAVKVAPADGGAFFVNCDILGVSAGWTPSVHLYSQSRGSLRYEETLGAYVPEKSLQAVTAVGASNGTLKLEEALREGMKAGAEAAIKAGHKIAPARAVKPPKTPAPEKEAPSEFHACFPLDAIENPGPKAFIDFQNDSTLDGIDLAIREGFRSVEHFKRYTTTGMATDQGKTSNVNAIHVASQIMGKPPPAVGLTTYRAPYSPVSLGAIAGNQRRDLFHVVRKTPIYSWHEENGAVFEPAGDWLRPWYYTTSHETLDEAVRRESTLARETAGLFDGTPLGKIRIEGPDAPWFLEMLYTNAWQKLDIGRMRYGIMLNEHGMVFDDGVTARIGPNAFHMNTTSAGAAAVMEWIEEWLQTEWPEKKVWATSVSEQWAVITLSGPYARRILQPLVDIDLEAGQFPFMSFKKASLKGCPAHIYRISFTGELSYEINVPARFGLAIWELMMREGRKYNICAYGTETLHLLSTEKGYITIGQDTDGTATPLDLGLDWIVSKKKKDFLGRRSLFRSDTARKGRKQFVGLLASNPAVVIAEGAHIVGARHGPGSQKPLGHVSSSYFSPALECGIAAALIEDGFNLKGQTLWAIMPDGKKIGVTVTDATFFDKKGERADGLE